MTRQLSPFATLSGAEKQIRWLEYQSIRLPYIEVKKEPLKEENQAQTASSCISVQQNEEKFKTQERPVPPPEVPRTLPADYNRTRHSQYDAVIARMKQAELQTQRSNTLHSAQ